MDEIIQLKNFTMKRGDNVLLENAVLNIERGQVTFLLGENGCGKSTLLSLFRKERKIGKLNGGTTYEGELNVSIDGETYNLVTCDGSDVKYGNFYYGNIAYLDQSELFESFASIVRTLRLPTELALYELKRANKINTEQYKDKMGQLEKEVEKCISILKEHSEYEAGPRRLNKTRHLSGGQKRLVSFFRTYIRAVVLGVRLLVLDEPLNHLDCMFKKTINDCLASLVKNSKAAGNPITIIIVSHCLPFDFIKEDCCKQYRFADKGLRLLEEKIQHTDCLKN